MADEFPDSSKGWRLEDLKRIATMAGEKRAGDLLRFFGPYVRSTQPKQIEKLVRANPAVHFLGQRGNILTFRAPRLEQLPRLPRGYVFKGGAARIALQVLCGDPISKLRPRDIDVVRFGLSPSKTDAQVAAALMPDDWRHGHGVELVASEQDYFATRDLTINETYLSSQQLVVSERAIEDMRAGVLRPTDFALAQGRREQGKLLLKMLRLSEEARMLGCSYRLEGLPRDPEIHEFDVRLNLSKAAQVAPELEQVLLKEYEKLAAN